MKIDRPFLRPNPPHNPSGDGIASNRHSGILSCRDVTWRTRIFSRKDTAPPPGPGTGPLAVVAPPGSPCIVNGEGGRGNSVFSVMVPCHPCPVPPPQREDSIYGDYRDT